LLEGSQVMLPLTTAWKRLFSSIETHESLTLEVGPHIYHCTYAYFDMAMNVAIQVKISIFLVEQCN